MTDTKLLDSVSMTLNPEDNGGESVTLTVDIYDNGDAAAGLPDGIFTLGSVSLQSYGNAASITLPNVSPEFLRKFADELEAKLAAVEASFN